MRRFFFLSLAAVRAACSALSFSACRSLRAKVLQRQTRQLLPDIWTMQEDLHISFNFVDWAGAWRRDIPFLLLSLLAMKDAISFKASSLNCWLGDSAAGGPLEARFL